MGRGDPSFVTCVAKFQLGDSEVLIWQALRVSFLLLIVQLKMTLLAGVEDSRPEFHDFVAKLVESICVDSGRFFLYKIFW